MSPPDALWVLYRGPLSSCNYGCAYCPFAKRRETRDELDRDARALDRFVAWAEEHPQRRLSVLFTPWGEALTRRWYRDALARLTSLAHVERAAVQTNLSVRLGWTERCDLTKLALWCTWHPTEVSRERFVARCRELDRRGVRYSVGVVGLREHVEAIEALRRELAPEVYLWVNAYKRVEGYYAPEEVARIVAVDPLFAWNSTRHPSEGRDCRAGHTVISVDGDGTMRRCHFIREPVGNLYDEGWERALRRAPCTNATCGCHIGYVHMDDLGLYDVFEGGVLERIPARRSLPMIVER